MKGFIKLPRDFLQWEWWGRLPHHLLFEWLLIKAHVTDQKVQGMMVRRGSVLTTWSEMEKAVGCSRGSLSRAIKDLSECGEIVTRTDCRNTLVTVCHYEDYNGDSRTLWTDSGLIADCKRTDTPIYKGEIENIENEDIYSARAQIDDFFVSEYDCRQWMQQYNQIAASFGAKPADQLNSKRRLLIGQRVRERGRGSVDVLFQQLARSAYFFGEGSRGYRGDFTNLWTQDVYTKVCEGYYIPQAKSKRQEAKSKVVEVREHEYKTEPRMGQKEKYEALVAVVAKNPNSHCLPTLKAAYESGELRELGIDWKPNNE